MKKKRRLPRAQPAGTQSFPSETPEVMDIKRLARYLGIGRSKIYGLIRQKKIPASRIGRQYRFSKPLIDAWLKENLIISHESQMGLFGR